MDVTLGGIAGMIAACAFLVLVGFMAVPLWKLGKTIDGLTETTKALADGTPPILDEAKGTVTSLNTELVKLGDITEDAASVTGRAREIAGDASQLSVLVTSTLAVPLIKLSAFSYGVRRAIASVRKKS